MIDGIIKMMNDLGGDHATVELISEPKDTGKRYLVRIFVQDITDDEEDE